MGRSAGSVRGGEDSSGVRSQVCARRGSFYWGAAPGVRTAGKILVGCSGR